ncbi:MAG: RpiB/LacA/LacB family sugar-phosphate isomerase [Bacteroidota bacterium]
MKIGVAADHGGFELKEELIVYTRSLGYEVKDFGAFELNQEDDYPDYIVPLSKAVASKQIERGIAVCGSGVGAAIVANKIAGVRACLINDHFSAHQGVEDDDLNILCLGGRVTGKMAAQEYISAFLRAKFTGEERHVRRLQKIKTLEE